MIYTPKYVAYFLYFVVVLVRWLPSQGSPLGHQICQIRKLSIQNKEKILKINESYLVGCVLILM